MTLDSATLARLQTRRSNIKSRRNLDAQEPMAALPLKFKDEDEVDEPNVHPFARSAYLYVEGETSTLCSPTTSMYSATTFAASAGHQQVDARIADLEDQLRALQDRLAENDQRLAKEGTKLRGAKSMPFLRRFGRRGEKQGSRGKDKEDKETLEFIAFVEAKRNGGGEATATKVKKSDKECDIMGTNLRNSAKSVIDLSHLVSKVCGRR